MPLHLTPSPTATTRLSLRRASDRLNARQCGANWRKLFAPETACSKSDAAPAWMRASWRNAVCESWPAIHSPRDDRGGHAPSQRTRKLQRLVQPARTCALRRSSQLLADESFDGAFSNFGALNCVQDLAAACRDLARLLKPGATALLCWMGPCCLWEISGISRREPAKRRFGAFSAEGVDAPNRRWSLRPRPLSFGEIAGASVCSRISA